MGSCRQAHSTSACNKRVVNGRQPSHVQEELRSAYSSDANAATRHNGNSMLSEAETQQVGGERSTGALVQDVSSDSDSDIELASEEEELFKLGEGIWVHEKILAYFKKPKDIDILLYHTMPDEPDDDYTWKAIAPEWEGAQGFGYCREEASEDLQSQLLDLNLIAIEDKKVAYIKRLPIEPCWKKADKARRRSLWASYYDDLEKDCKTWEWGKIRV